MAAIASSVHGVAATSAASLVVGAREHLGKCVDFRGLVMSLMCVVVACSYVGRL
jgi:hypothetical protein